MIIGSPEVDISGDTKCIYSSYRMTKWRTQKETTAGKKINCISLNELAVAKR